MIARLFPTEGYFFFYAGEGVVVLLGPTCAAGRGHGRRGGGLDGNVLFCWQSQLCSFSCLKCSVGHAAMATVRGTIV